MQDKSTFCLLIMWRIRERLGRSWKNPFLGQVDLLFIIKNLPKLLADLAPALPSVKCVEIMSSTAVSGRQKSRLTTSTLANPQGIKSDQKQAGAS